MISSIPGVGGGCEKDLSSRAVLRVPAGTFYRAEALERYGTPEIFDSDQGSQFTSIAFTGLLLEAAGGRCSMDGRGPCLDNVFIERLRRSL